MTSAGIRALLEQFRQAWERGDAAALAGCYTGDCEVLSPLFHTLHGRAQVDESFLSLFRAFGDHRIRIDNIIIDSDRREQAMMKWIGQATHRGESLACPAPERGSKSAWDSSSRSKTA